jgi:hypothetical protein
MKRVCSVSGSCIKRKYQMAQPICGTWVRGLAQMGFGHHDQSILMPASPVKWPRYFGNRFARTKTDENTGRSFPLRDRGKDGLPLFKWADIDVAPRSHVEKGVQGERRQIANDCFALAMKIDHYNATHPNEDPMQTSFNFEEDIEEMKITRGIDDDDKAA